MATSVGDNPPSLSSLSLSSPPIRKPRRLPRSFTVRRMSDEQWKIYHDAIAISDGFDVPEFPGVQQCILHRAVVNNPELDKYLAEEALNHYKTTVNKDANLRFVKAVKRNQQYLGSTITHYLTFEAIDDAANQGPPITKTYQAIIEKPLMSSCVVEMCRLQPPTAA